MSAKYLFLVLTVMERCLLRYVGRVPLFSRSKPVHEWHAHRLGRPHQFAGSTTGVYIYTYRTRVRGLVRCASYSGISRTEGHTRDCSISFHLPSPDTTSVHASVVWSGPVVMCERSVFDIDESLARFPSFLMYTSYRWGKLVDNHCDLPWFIHQTLCGWKRVEQVAT